LHWRLGVSDYVFCNGERNCRPSLLETHVLLLRSWAPYSLTYSGQNRKGSPTFSKGIWKPVYVLGIVPGSAAIEYVTPRVKYLGAYPLVPLSDDAPHGDFEVDVVVHFRAPAATSGILRVTGAWGSEASVPVALPAGSSNVTVSLVAANNSVRLWWPAQTAGGGGQPLYAVNVSFLPSSGGSWALVADSRRVGFRVFALVTGNDTDPSTLAGKDGQETYTMRFKVRCVAAHAFVDRKLDVF
jgi:beta-mannosidase